MKVTESVLPPEPLIAEGASPAKSPSAVPTLLILVLFGCFSALLQVLTKAVLRSGTFLVDGYWASFYTMTYSDGFRRRALMGSLLRLLQPHGGSIILINVFSAAVLGALLFLFFTQLLRHVRVLTPWAYVLFTAFVASALVEIYFEVLGDLLQLCLLLFLLVYWLLDTRLRSTTARVALILPTVALCFLIHEASIFFIAPCLPFLLHPKPRVKDFWVSVVVLALFLAWSSHWSVLHAESTYHLNLLHGQKEIVLEDTKGTPSFMQLLHSLYGVNYVGIKGKVRLLEKCARIMVLILAGWVALANLFTEKRLARQIYVYVALMVAAVPFWVIAFDWGRFTTYNFLLVITLACWDHGAEEDTYFSHAAQRLRWISSFTLVRVTALIALVRSPFAVSRLYGVDLHDLLLVIFLGAFAYAQVVGWIPDMTSIASPESVA